MAADKRSSYPSRQMRQGPAPLASFEDLSDEIESPTEKNSHSLPEIEEELKLFADAATPTTTSLLATTPSTPHADLSSASTPRVGISESWETNLDDDGCVTGGSAFPSQSCSRDSVLDSSREGLAYHESNQITLPQVNGIKNSVSSSFMDDVKGAEAASVLANSLPERSATPECLPQKAPTKKSSLTTGQASRTPSRTPSPNSPRRFFAFFKHKDECSEPGSPSSPKSPRKSSFTNLFKIGRDTRDGRDENDHGGASPTRRKSSLSVFFKGGKDSSKPKKSITDGGDSHFISKGKKEASNRSVFSTLFRKGDRKAECKSPVKLTLQATSVDIPIELDAGGTGTGWTSREISLHSHLCDLQDKDEIPGTVEDELDDVSPSVNGQLQAEIQIHAEPEEYTKAVTELEETTEIVHMTGSGDFHNEPEVIATTVLNEKYSFDKELLHKDDTILSEDDVSSKDKTRIPSEDKLSSGSEQESDFDPVSLKKRINSEDYEAETLIDEELDYDEFPINLDLISDSSKKTTVTPIRKPRSIGITTVPIDRPRSSTPLSITSLEAYIQTASPPTDRMLREGEKLKVSLPGDDFSVKGKSPRKLPIKNWQEFCQEALQSPRMRRKEQDDSISVTTLSEGTSIQQPPSMSWVTFENTSEIRKPTIFEHREKIVYVQSEVEKVSSNEVDVNSASENGDEEASSVFTNDTFGTNSRFFHHQNIEPSLVSRDSFTESYTDHHKDEGLTFHHPQSVLKNVHSTLDSFSPEGFATDNHVVDGHCFDKEVHKESGFDDESTDTNILHSAGQNLFGTIMKTKRDVSRNNLEASRTLSSSDSVSSGDVPIRLDSVEGLDPLLDPCSESDVNHEETDKDCYSEIFDITKRDLNSLFSEDQKRSGGLVVQEMNFIKKKIKGPKKGLHTDDDDFDPAFIPPTRVPEGAPKGWVPYEERIDEDSEEWLAFKKLTERVTETLQKTQDNLTKIVATSAVPEGVLEIKTSADEEFDDSFTDEKKTGKSWINFEDDSSSFDSNTPPSSFATPSKSGKPPPRPPPPKHEPPPRPVPPKLHKDDFEDFLGIESSAPSYYVTEPINDSRTDKNVGKLLEFSLDDDFGFTSDNNITNEFGFLDVEINTNPLDEDGKDPFDTSFIQVTPSEVCIVKVNGLIDSSRSQKTNGKETLFDEGDLLAGLSVNEDDPFTYPEDIGVVKTPIESSPKEKDTMNLSFPQFRAKSPNPFLNGASSEAASTNPFLTRSTEETTQSSSDQLNFFEDNKPSQSSNPFVIHDTKNEMVDLFSVENDFSTKTTSIQPSKAIDFLSDDLLSGQSTVKGTDSTNLSVGFDFFESTVPEESVDKNNKNTQNDLFDFSLTSTTSGIGTTNSQTFVKADRSVSNQPKADEIDFLSSTDSIDFFGSVPTTSNLTVTSDSHSKQTASFLDDDLFNSVIDSKQGTSIPFSDDLFNTSNSGTSFVPHVEKKQEGTLKSDEDFDSFFDSRRSSASGSGSIKHGPTIVPIQPVQSSVHHNTFDVFDSVSRPINAFDGLPPPLPKIKLEIPMELKQNAEVLEALGQKGPKTPIEPLNIFDLPTPVPGEENEFDLGIADISDEPVQENPPFEESTEMLDQPVKSFEVLDEKIKQSEMPESLSELDKIHPVTEEFSKLPDEDENEVIPTSTEASFSALPPPVEASAELASTEESFTALDQANFDAFAARFENTTVITEKANEFDPFSAPASVVSAKPSLDMSAQGFGVIDEFDPFLSMTEPPAPPQPSPAKFQQKDDDSDSDDSGPDFSVFIRPRMRDKTEIDVPEGPMPMLPPPPKSPLRSPSHASPTPRFNPFDKQNDFLSADVVTESPELSIQSEVPDVSLPEEVIKKEIQRTESQESAGTPLFEEDDTEPLEEFPSKYEGDGWELMLRQPNKKKITGQRFWKKVFVRLSDHVLHLYNSKEDKDPFQELPLQACYSLSEISAQQYDQYGKIFTVKLQYVFYRERVGVRPGQISKVTQGQITSFGQLAKLGLPLEHAPQVSQLLKIGTQTYTDIKVFAVEIEDALFRLTVHRDRALTYKTEEIQVSVQDETFADVSKTGHVNKQLARVRIFFLAFISGMPNVELGINDIERKGKEIVGRYDIIPVVTEEWIRLENVEFHSCINQEEFEKTRTIKLHPPDACFFELLRFRVRPPKNRELPLQVKVMMTISDNRVEIRCDILVPGFSGRKHGQIPCEDVAVRFPIPECWIYLFRVEKHFRYGSIKSAARKPGKIKGLERFMGAANTLDPSLIEVSTGQAKYEHQHHAIVWRIPRLPKEGQGAYTEHNFVCRLELTSYDQMPEELADYVHVEFTMPATTVSHTTVRSVSVSNPNPPEKHVRYISKHEYLVEVNHMKGFAANEYVSATATSGTTKESAQASPASSTPS